MNKMLISATQLDEVRVALVKEQKLYDLNTEQAGLEQKKANIYKGRVARIEPSLEAAFIDYGADRHGFLPFKEVARSCLRSELASESFKSLDIKDVLREGQEIIVQIDKEERGNKGAALTTFISLAGSYLVLMPNNPRVGGVSRRIDGKERDELKDLLHNLSVPEGMGIIVRTAGVGKSHEELKWDLESLIRRWQVIQEVSVTAPTPSLIYQEGDAVMRAVRDYLRPDIVEILVDEPTLFTKTKQYIEQIKPEFLDKVQLYTGESSLFSFYQIEKQIETAYQRVVKLPSGGSISIDHTEALISIDVNSAKSTSGGDIEETAFSTNLEAAEEIARQLRIRDLGGLIVIDFIDMYKVKNQQEVSRRLREFLEYDRARVQVGNITRFGLLEMSRQRLGSYLGSSFQVTCPRCEGQGSIRSIESLASSIIRLVEEEGYKKETAKVEVQLPIDLATFVLNEKRDVLVDMARRLNVEITILPNQHLETPHHKIKRYKRQESQLKNTLPSYKVVEVPELDTPEKVVVAPKVLEKPVVDMTLATLKYPGVKQNLVVRMLVALGRGLGLLKNPDNTCTTKRAIPASSAADTNIGYRPRTRYNGAKRYRRSGSSSNVLENKKGKRSVSTGSMLRKGPVSSKPKDLNSTRSEGNITGEKTGVESSAALGSVDARSDSRERTAAEGHVNNE